MPPAPHQYGMCSPAPSVLQYSVWVSLVFNTPVLSIFLVAHCHTVTMATSPFPFLSIQLLFACCCTERSLNVLDTSSCATGASQMFPHSLCLFFLLRVVFLGAKVLNHHKVQWAECFSSVGGSFDIVSNSLMLGHRDFLLPSKSLAFSHLCIRCEA